VVNLFDTGQASRLLQLPSAGLAHLLDTLCAFKADKRFALADWRLRPLSSDMAHYARCDTHFLLHCYDRLRGMLRALPPPGPPPPADADAPNAAVREVPVSFAPWEEGEAFGAEHGALPAAWARSGGVALRLYRREAPPGPDAAATMASRAGAPLSSAGLAALGALLAWRDAAARAADESAGYVLSKAVALRLAASASAAGAAPPDARAVAAACGREAPFSAARADELAHIMAAAVAAARAAHVTSPPVQPAPPPQPLAVPHAAPEADETEQPVRKRRAIALAPPPAGGGALGGMLQQRGAASDADAGAASRVRASFALPLP
jgi:exosome complex exonuclease RRP6